MFTILFVGVERATRCEIQRVLTPFECHAIYAESVEDAMDVLKTYQCQLVFCELDLPTHLNGLDLWTYCRMTYPDIGFVLLMELPDHLFGELINAGVPCPPYISKPISLPDCRRSLGELFALGESVEHHEESRQSA